MTPELHTEIRIAREDCAAANDRIKLLWVDMQALQQKIHAAYAELMAQRKRLNDLLLEAGEPQENGNDDQA